MSLIEALSSSAAAATLSTLMEASLEALPATWTRSLVWRDTAERSPEVLRISPDASLNSPQRLAHRALELADIGLDRALARGSADVAFALVLLDLELLGGLLLEGFQRAGKRADLVLAIEIAAVDGEIAAGDLQHGIADGVERGDDAAADQHDRADGKPNGERQQHELHDQCALRGAALLQRVHLGGIERALRRPRPRSPCGRP